FDTILPFNMRSMIEISLSYTRLERLDGFIFEELINKNYPILNFYGKNEKQNLYEKKISDNKVRNTMIKATNETKNDSIATLNHNNIVKIFKDDSYIEQYELTNNSMYIPIDYMKKGYHARLDLEFSRENGHLNLSYLNKYYNEKAKDYIHFEIYVNDRKVLTEDISQWNNDVSTTIFNLKKG